MEPFSSIVDDLYAGTLDDAVWTRGLLGVADSVRASAILLLAFSPSTGALLREENHRLDPRLLDDYGRYWTFQDCRREPFLAVPAGCPITEAMLAIPNWHRTPILNEFLLPGDAPHFMPVWLRKTKTKAVALSLQGTRKRGAFDVQDRECLRFFVPHISRALEIRDRLEAAHVRANALASCVDRVDFGVITLTASRRILDANAAAEQMLRCDESIRITPDRTLHLREPAGSQLLRWLTKRAPDDDPADYLVRIDRGPGRPPISVLMTSTPQCSPRWVSVEPACILFLFDPERELRASPSLVAAEMHISAREAELATLLAGGLELSEVAQRLRISIHTARTHLKAIYGKTGIGSQPELVRRIVTGLAVRGPPPPSKERQRVAPRMHDS